MKATIQAKVIRVQENNSKNGEYNKEFPFLVDLLMPEVMGGEKVAIPYTRIASKVSVEKGDQSLEINVDSGKYEIRMTIQSAIKEKKGV